MTTASFLHYIVKIRISDEILNKPGRLTDEEFKIMKTHSEFGADMIRDMHFPKDNSLVRALWEICRWHHVRWDGKGY
ncbi:HD domain-containing protein, partial [Phocaeicola vulgatus]|nr:HD domain-containing protein [Phocaeicola vulgatus]